jgi:hypothetical protein
MDMGMSCHTTFSIVNRQSPIGNQQSAMKTSSLVAAVPRCVSVVRVVDCFTVPHPLAYGLPPATAGCAKNPTLECSGFDKYAPHPAQFPHLTNAAMPLY